MALALSAGAALAWGQEAAKPSAPLPFPKPSAEALQFFESKVRPVLVQQCGACHGEKSARGGLRLDLYAALLKGGESGPAIQPGDPDKSPLIQVLRYDGPVKMPPQGKLRAQQIEDLTAWVRMGAPWPEEKGKGQDAARGHAAPSGPHWAFQPVKPPAIPAFPKAKALVRNPIDAFIRQQLTSKGIQPAPRATKRELIRRLYFDLIGLPPAAEEVDRFTADTDPLAYEKLVDQLLARPQFGERWGRHWLDVVRYGQTNGYERDDEKMHSWRYRDYVIQSFNADKPYDQFLKEQLAGDELDTVTDHSLIATGFYRIGVWDDEPDDAKQAEFDNLDDVLSTATQAMLGLTVGCARCHDHKFDPVSQEEYYGLLSFMRNVRRYANVDPAKDRDPAIFHKLTDGTETLAVKETGTAPLKTTILIRGNAATPGPEVQPRFLSALRGGKPWLPELPPSGTNGKTTGRRRVLAEWIASRENPLTARVMVNRVWSHLFGRGLVESANDFGRNGEKPTHPELLDHLAGRFSGAWSIKSLIRQIVTSETYRQSSRTANPKGVATDPGNTLLWRQNLRRLQAEAIRDSILATSGKLNLAMGGRGIFPKLPPEVLSTQSRPGSGWDQNLSEVVRSRRSVYVFVKWTLGVRFLEVFDATTPDSSVAKRPTPTIAPQALVMLNSAFMDEQSEAFAVRLLKEAGPDLDQQVQRAFRVALGRQPTAREAQVGRDYITRQLQLVSPGPSPEPAQRKALAAFCKVVLNLNEFVYVD